MRRRAVLFLAVTLAACATLPPAPETPAQASRETHQGAPPCLQPLRLSASRP